MDTPSFNACYEATRSPLLAYLTRVSGNPALAEDLLQEAYVRLLCHPPADAQPPRLRQHCLLWLCHVEEFEHAEVAHTLGSSPKSVKVLLHRARHRMNLALAELERPFTGGPR